MAARSIDSAIGARSTFSACGRATSTPCSRRRCSDPACSRSQLRTDLYHDDERVRRLVLAAAEAGRAEIRLWGDVWPEDFDGSGDRVSHRLSLAALAFKAQALAAADLRDAPTAETEAFRRGELGRPLLAAVSLQNV